MITGIKESYGPAPISINPTSSAPSCPTVQSEFQQIQQFIISKSSLFGSPAPAFVTNQLVQMSGASISISTSQFGQTFDGPAAGASSPIIVIHFKQFNPSQFVRYSVADMALTGTVAIDLPPGILVFAPESINACHIAFDQPFDSFYVSYSTVDTTGAIKFQPTDIVINVYPCAASLRNINSIG